MKNFKAKELLKDKLIAVFIDSKCVICNEEKECLEIVTTPYSTLCVCLDCLQYECEHCKTLEQHEYGELYKEEQ